MQLLPPPPRSPRNRASQNGPAVLLALGILSPGKITVKVVRPRCCGRSTLTVIFPGKNRHLS
ncbi:MAG TPA: hypothetical protein VIV12_10365 [Streptosporangiaceae bacterium]